MNLPRLAARNFVRLKEKIISFFYIGNGRYCPVCGRSSSKFASYGRNPRNDARCMHCGSLERHRFAWLFLQQKTDLFNQQAKKMLHIAPQPAFEKRFRRQLGDGYLTADLHDPRAMVQMDITDINYPAHSFDVIYCSHVLEHVPEDETALRELYRVLKDDGWALIMVPVTAEQTSEDPALTGPSERLRRFGQEDHVRRYGPDFTQRLEKAGFSVAIISPESFLNMDEMQRMGIDTYAGDIFYCTRQPIPKNTP